MITAMTLQANPSLDAELDAHTLRIVRAIVEHGSITAAAQSLGYSQPAVSQHLRRAETRLGMPLVARSGRGVRLTEAGLVLARHARTVTTALDAAAGELAELAGLRAGRVRLAAFPTASATVVPRVLQQLAHAHAGIGVSYLEAEPPEAVDAVRDARADLAITFSYPGDVDDPHGESARGLDVRALWRDEMMVVMPNGHPAARRAVVRLGELGRDPWIAGCPRCRGHLLQLARAEGFHPGIGYETDNFTAVLGMVAAGLGVALLPALALAATNLPADVTVRPTVNHDTRTVHLVSALGALDVPAIAATVRSILALDGGEWGLTAP